MVIGVSVTNETTDEILSEFLYEDVNRVKFTEYNHGTKQFTFDIRSVYHCSDLTCQTGQFSKE